MLVTAGILIAVVIFDWFAGDPKHWHPLAGFGHMASWLEKHCNQSANTQVQLVLGSLCWCVAVLPLTIVSYYLSSLPYIGIAITALLLYFSLAHRSLYDHIRPIMHALSQGDRNAAKHYTSYIVSRDKDHIDVEKASIESILENGSDAIFASIFWFIVLGAPGVILHRLSNTLDAMWGYKSPRFLYFGRAAAYLDDVLNFIPARLTALSYALCGNTRLALHCWRQQARLWDSPNAGPVMAAGAGALAISLGGQAVYAGQTHYRPVLGYGAVPTATDIPRALRLISHSLFLWLVLYLFIAGVSSYV